MRTCNVVAFLERSNREADSTAIFKKEMQTRQSYSCRTAKGQIYRNSSGGNHAIIAFASRA